MIKRIKAPFTSHAQLKLVLNQVMDVKLGPEATGSLLLTVPSGPIYKRFFARLKKSRHILL